MSLDIIRTRRRWKLFWTPQSQTMCRSWRATLECWITMHSSFHKLPHFLSRFIVSCGLAKNGRGEQSRRRCFKRQRSYRARRLYLRITTLRGRWDWLVTHRRSVLVQYYRRWMQVERNIRSGLRRGRWRLLKEITASSKRRLWPSFMVLNTFTTTCMVRDSHWLRIIGRYSEYLEQDVGYQIWRPRGWFVGV